MRGDPPSSLLPEASASRISRSLTVAAAHSGRADFRPGTISGHECEGRVKKQGEKSKEAGDWFLYVVRCAGGELYTGVANDVARRFAEHSQGKRGAKFLRGKAPLKLVFVAGAGDRAAACRLEAAFKKLDSLIKHARVTGHPHIS